MPGFRILHIDDDPEYRRMVARFLTPLGFEVSGSDSAFGLVNKAAGRAGPKPHLIILDQMMPAITGTRMLELLGKDPLAAQTPVLLHSALDEVELRPVAALHPRARFLQKGSLHQLIAKINAMVGEPVTAVTQRSGSGSGSGSGEGPAMA